MMFLTRSAAVLVAAATLSAAGPGSAVPARPDDKTILHVLNRIGFGFVNLFMRLRRCGFRGFVHPLDDLVEAARGYGFRLASHERATTVWQVAILTRGSDPGHVPSGRG